MVFIDTHIAVWLYNGDTERLSIKGKKALDTNDIYISPICKLELEYLFEIGKIKKNSSEILGDLADSIDLVIDDISMDDIINKAIAEKWTRDPFDRMIVAHAKIRNSILISADSNIAKHYKRTLL